MCPKTSVCRLAKRLFFSASVASPSVGATSFCLCGCVWTATRPRHDHLIHQGRLMIKTEMTLRLSSGPPAAASTYRVAEQVPAGYVASAFDIGEEIGLGSFGVIFKGRNKVNGELVAIKEGSDCSGHATS